MSMSGDIHVQIDRKCVHTIKDFEGTLVLEGSVGEIDKKAHPELSHLTDGFGYYVEREFPIIRLVQPSSSFWK
jgi:hypothetical protein